MTAPTHVYVTAHGTYYAGPWAGETAQFGLRLTCEEAGSEPAKGSIYTPGVNGDVALVSGTQAGTHGTLAKTFSFRLGGTGSTINWDADWQIDIAEDLWTFLDGTKIFLRSQFRWTHVKQCPVGADGKAIGYSSTYTFGTPVTGSATGQLPPQCAMAISLRAPVTGRRGRGRIYLPAIRSSSVDADAVIQTADANSIRSTFVTLITNLQDPPGAPAFVPIVAVMSAGSATAVRPTQVRTGSRIDTIRSRREQIAETYTATDL